MLPTAGSGVLACWWKSAAGGAPAGWAGSAPGAPCDPALAAAAACCCCVSLAAPRAGRASTGSGLAAVGRCRAGRAAPDPRGSRGASSACREKQLNAWCDTFPSAGVPVQCMHRQYAMAGLVRMSKSILRAMGSAWLLDTSLFHEAGP